MKTRLKNDRIIIVAILLIPVIAYSYLLFPTENSIKLFGFELNSGFFVNIQSMAWVFVQKLMLILTFAIWYITCKDWWKNILFVPIAFFVFQLISALGESSFFDSDEFIFCTLITLPIVAGFFILTRRIKRFLESTQSDVELESEIEEILYELSSDKIKRLQEKIKRFNELKKLRKNLDQEIYLKELYKLKKEFSN